ncbi:nicotinamide riboside transporter PnuC [Planctobacterium marinum]|uniref:Nicotinamide riboside transporter PnuC n=1 Tax=Planctobacterium marinum TaxID=1631968 RepID=A0AA48HHX8_9ALTE|nr:nicotinamide mononucleotide transporter [Planctobacterium marinum]
MLISFATHPLTEFLAICSFLLYVLLSAKGNIWCWAAGFLTAFLYTFVFIGAHLPGQVALNIVYMMMSIWGWSVWLENSKPDGISIFTFGDVRKHIVFTTGIMILATGISLLMPSYFTSAQPVFEASVIGLSVYATILTVFRKIESWLFWMVINLASFILFFEENLLQTSVMYGGLVLISAWGFYNWRKLRRVEKLQSIKQ